jgi:radical SAM superfamily enzyme YgiQ (UPF0313 family)
MDLQSIVLIQPAHAGRIWGKAVGSPYTLMRLASMIPSDIPVEIWDENLAPLNYERLNSRTLVGITSMTLTIDGAKEIATRARQRGSKVVVGGVHATLVPDEIETWADAAVVGEAYRTWPQLVEDVVNGNLQPRYVDEEWTTLDHLAPISARVIQQVKEHRNYWTPSLEITRGCPRNCTFCTAIRVSGNIMRLRPIDQIVEEIERRKVKRFFLTDDNFGLNFRTNPAYIEKAFLALEKVQLRGWAAQSELIIGEFPEMLGLARRAHMDKFFVGFESINPDNRHELGGKTKGQVSDYKRIVRTIHDHGLNVVGLFVFGFDHDAVDVFEKTWQFIRETEFDSVSVTVLTPFPGTPQRQTLIEEGRLMPNIPWRHYDTSHVTFRPNLMTVAQLREGYDWMCRHVYAPRYIATRSLRTLRRYPLRLARSKAFSSFSTDVGYRHAYAFRDR